MRPWGSLEWVIAKTPRAGSRRTLIGCIGFEERSTAVPRLMYGHGVRDINLFTVTDPPSRYSARIAEKIATNTETLWEAKVCDTRPISTLSLFALDEEIAAIAQPVRDGTETELWLDITSMPKRFFFLLVKLALNTPSVSSLFVTYSQPAPGRYTREHLAEDPEMPQPLPGFGPLASDLDRLVVAVGFEPLGLSQLLGDYRDRKRDIYFIVPFPPGQPYSRRVWSTIHNIGFPGDHRVRRVPALDTFGCVDVLTTLTSEADHGNVALAPYGPKPISLGMCVYAARTGAAVFYTQPRVYHPDYTVGIGKTWAYCLRLAGRDTAFAR